MIHVSRTLTCLLGCLALASSLAWADNRSRPTPRPTRVEASASSPRDAYDELRKPKNAVDAFNTLLSSGSGKALVRRFGDDNPMAWNHVLDVIASARPGGALKSSFFTTEKDAYGWSYLGGLLYAQMRGVHVTHLNDWLANSRARGFVTRGAGYGVLQELARYGSTVGVFNTPIKRIKHFFKHGLSYGLLGCNHDKALVANPGTEDARGLNGGRNIGKAYYQAPGRQIRSSDGTTTRVPGDNDQAWRDDTIDIKGSEACEGLAQAVDRELSVPAMKLVKAPLFGLKPRAREMLAAYALMEEWVERAPLSAGEKARLRANPRALAELGQQVLASSEKRLRAMIGSLPTDIQRKIPKDLGWAARRNLAKLAGDLSRDLELCGTRAAYRNLGGFMKARVKVIDQTGAASAAPGKRFNEMMPNLRQLILGARKQILIINPYVVLTEEMVRLFEEGAKAGVKYRIVTNSPMSTDSAITQGFFLNSWANVLARVPTMEIWVATGKRKIHAKAFVVDDVVSGDTTYNADLLSALVNGELGTISLSRKVARDLTAGIAKDLSDPANGFRQWTIKKDERGRAVLDGKGRPIVLHGPKDDVSLRLRALYTPVRWLCKLITATRGGAPLRLQKAKDVLPARDW
jgi:phosphatidylserine/phosphatidylglycerophosphate/cardiolipin synthase-like enzyme